MTAPLSQAVASITCGTITTESFEVLQKVFVRERAVLVNTFLTDLAHSPISIVGPLVCY